MAFLGIKLIFLLIFIMTCIIEKGKIPPFPSHGSCALASFDLIHSNIWKISPIISHSHYKYFVTFIDDYGRYTWIHFLRSKSEIFSTLSTTNESSVILPEFELDSNGPTYDPQVELVSSGPSSDHRLKSGLVYQRRRPTATMPPPTALDPPITISRPSLEIPLRHST